MKKQITTIVIPILILIASSIKADDGMWMPHQMKMLNLQKEGLQMNPDELFKADGTGLMSAVVHLGGGTGEFVSKEGLILTNHHVAFGAIQRASSTENDYISNGFLAKDKRSEIQAHGYVADVLLGYEDITDKVEAVLKAKMTFAERETAIDQVHKKIIAKTEKGSKDIIAKIAVMYSGNKHYLFRFKHIKDVRLVYAPPREIGNYGGNIDNWMWPRHTCDFTFLRAYVSPEGEGIAYDEKNVPYIPKSVMKISLDGLKEGDFTFVMGYPGTTYRNYTLGEVKISLKELNYKLDEYLANIDFYEAESKKSKEVEIKYARTVKGMHNATKNYTGKLEGFEKVKLLQKKKEQQEKSQAWILENSSENKIALTAFENYLNTYSEWAEKNLIIENLVNSRFGSTLLEQAHFIYQAAHERQKNDMDRDEKFQDRGWEDQKRKNLLTETGYNFDTDRKFLKYRLERMMDKPSYLIPQALQELFAQKSVDLIHSFVDNIYDNTVIGNAEKRQEMMDMTPKQLAALNDPFISFAGKIENELKQIRKESKAIKQEYADRKKPYMSAVLEMNKGRISPDANSTIRFTYGNIEGYEPADAVYYKPFTTLKGVMEKETGVFPFSVSDKLKDLYKNKDFGKFEDEKYGDIVTCFLNTTNVTGGNSGSATLNAKGEQVGIIFDMTYESVTGDYYVIPELQRTISVDIRYVLFITEKFSDAGFLLEEMGI